MPDPFTAAPHHDILFLLVQLAVLLFTARLFGEIALRLGQPSVVGEILAGIILGPSLLSSLFPAFGEVIVPHEGVPGYLLEVVSLIGAMFLMLITGLETDLNLIKRHARTAIGVSLGGVAVSFAGGFIVGQLLPDDLLADPNQRLVFALFVATTMAITAIPVIAKVLMDMNLVRRDIGQTILAAGMSDDTIGWTLLSVVTGLIGGTTLELSTLFRSLGSVALFLIVSFTIGLWLVRASLRYTLDEIKGRDKVLTLVVVWMFAWGAFTQFLEIEAVLGAFVMGILFSQMRSLPAETVHRLESIALGIFSPIFFAVAGLKVNIISLLTPRLMLVSVVILVVAIVGKTLGTYLGARLIGGKDHWTALAYGAGLNARGAIGIIIATIGLSLGILTQDMFSIIVLMAIVTSIYAPTMLRVVLARVQPDPEELQRLEREELAKDSLVANMHRVLLPVRPRPDGVGVAQVIEAKLLDRIDAQTDLSLTLMTVANGDGERNYAQNFLNQLETRFHQQPLSKRVVGAENAGDAILDEARKNYDLLVLGATESRSDSEVLFTPIIDYLVRLSPCPTLLVHGHNVPEDWSPKRILVPTNGSLASRRAAEIAFALVAGVGVEVAEPAKTAVGGENGAKAEINEDATSDDDYSVVILRVVEENRSSYRLDVGGMQIARHLNVAQRTVEQLRQMGEMQGVATMGEVRVGDEPETTILNIARADDIDLIVLGTNIHAGSERLYLGPRVERILANAPCPVIIVNS